MGQIANSEGGGAGVPQNIGALKNVTGLSRSQAQGAESLAVLKPRDLAAIENRVKFEAAKLGEAAMYSWEVKDKSSTTGKSRIMGLSVQAAHMLARNFGNCHIDTLIEETPAAIMFRARFTDLESGYTLVRPFRLDRRNMPQANYQEGRALDIATQIATSKAERNAILKAVPQHFQDMVLEIAQANLREKIEVEISQHGEQKVRDGYAKMLVSQGVKLANILSRFNKDKVMGLSVDDLVVMRIDARAIKAGESSAETLYPDPDAPEAGKRGNPGELFDGDGDPLSDLSG
jgi:hypothetical protein